jgi:hypothetical protein
MDDYGAGRGRTVDIAGGSGRREGGDAGIARCGACDGGPVVAEFQTAYGVDVCTRCKRLPAYDTIPKAKAKKEYLVTDKDLTGAGLRCLTRVNPQNKAWTPMQLYLKSQVRAEVTGPGEGTGDRLRVRVRVWDATEGRRDLRRG